MSLDQRGFPLKEQLAQMEPEDLGELILLAMKKQPDDQVSPHNTVLEFTQNSPGGAQLGANVAVRLKLAISEAFEWLRHAGLVTPAQQPGGGTWLVLSRRGRAIAGPSEFKDFLKGLQLPTHLLHPLFRDTAAKAFARGEPDVAVLHAFKHVEIEVRDAAGLPAEVLGVKLMRQAFKPDLDAPGPLTDTNAEAGERQARMDLFAGAIGSYKNPQSHRHVNLEDPIEAIEQVMLASHLLRIVDERRAAAET